MTCCSCLLPAQVSIAVLIDNFRSASKARRQRKAADAAVAARKAKSTNPLDPLLLHLCKVRAASLRPRRARRRRGAVGRCAAAYQPEGCASSGGSETDSPT